MRGDEWESKWKPAINKEFTTLNEMGTYESVAVEDIPTGAEIYPTKLYCLRNSMLLPIHFC